jgi:TonB family protein
MPKISYSLAMAFALHILILVGSTYLFDKESTPFLVDPKSLIVVQFGDGEGVTRRKEHTREIQGNLKNEKKISNITSVPRGDVGASDSAGTFFVTGKGSPSYDFASSAINYKGPIYPRLAVKREMEGTVLVKVAITAEGYPANIEILKSSGHDLLDKAAIDAISGWRFLPRSTPYFVEKNIVFQLKN